MVVMSFRSPLLRALPQSSRNPNRQNSLRRLLALMPVLLLFLIPVVLVKWRLLPGSGLGLYWLHDHFYLPLVGWTWTRFFPWSLIWWGALLSLLAFWLFAYLSGGSPLRHFHLRFALLLTSRPWARTALLKSEIWLLRYRPFSRLLLLAARRHAEFALISLRPRDRAELSPEDRAAAGAQVLFFIRLATLEGREDSDCLDALILWARLYRALGSLVKTETDPLYSAVAQALPSWPGKGRIGDRGQGGTSLWSSDSVYGDLQMWAALGDRALAEELLGKERAASAAKRRGIIALQLADHTEQRRAQLAKIRSVVEWHWPSIYNGGEVAIFPGQPGIAAEHAHVCGALSLELALATAALTAMAEAGIRMVEEMDALRLTMDLVAARQPFRRRAADRDLFVLYLMVQQMPSFEHYLACAEFRNKPFLLRQDQGGGAELAMAAQPGAHWREWQILAEAGT